MALIAALTLIVPNISHKAEPEAARKARIEFERLKAQGDPSVAKQADLLWAQAKAWGYPEGKSLAQDAMDKLDIEFERESGFNRLDYCQMALNRTEQYITFFHDDSPRWRQLIFLACNSLYTISDRDGSNAMAQKGARQWMEKAIKWNDDVQYAAALGFRIHCNDLQGEELRKTVTDALPRLLAARAGNTPETMLLAGGLTFCAGGMKQFDPATARKLDQARTAALARQFKPTERR